MSKRPRDPRRVRLIGVLTLLAAATLMVLDLMGFLAGAARNDPETRLVRAEFRDVQQLHNGDPVRVRGVGVGKVDEISVDGTSGTATVTLRVEKDTKLFRDARADVRWRTVLGGAFFVRLIPGVPSSGDLGSGAIPVSRTTGQVELEDVLSFDRGQTRRGLRTLPKELSAALDDPSTPAQALSRLADVAPTATRALSAVRGRQKGRDLPAVIANTAAVVRSLDSADDRMRAVVEGAAATLTTTAGRRADLAWSLRQAPATLAGVQRTLGPLDTTLGNLDGLLADLRDPADHVAPTLAAVRPTLVGADKLLRTAVPLLPPLRTAVTSLARTARDGRPLLNSLRPSISRLQDKVLPYFAEQDPGTKHSLSEMIGPALGHLGGGSTGQLDQNGHFIRFPATSGSSPLYSLPCQIYINNPDATRAVACKSLQETLDILASYNPLGPTPGTSPAPRPTGKASR